PEPSASVAEAAGSESAIVMGPDGTAMSGSESAASPRKPDRRAGRLGGKFVVCFSKTDDGAACVGFTVDRELAVGPKQQNAERHARGVGIQPIAEWVGRGTISEPVTGRAVVRIRQPRSR